MNLYSFWILFFVFWIVWLETIEHWLRFEWYDTNES